MALVKDAEGLPITDRMGNQLTRTSDGEIAERHRRRSLLEQRERINRENFKFNSQATPVERLAVLDRRLGINRGADKERIRLLAQIIKHQRASQETAQPEQAEKKTNKELRREKKAKHK